MSFARYFKNKESHKIICECTRCKSNYEITLPVKEFKNFERWEWDDTMMIQDAIPSVPKVFRELFISGICGECFEELFKED